jgi:hypothetical protein
MLLIRYLSLVGKHIRKYHTKEKLTDMVSRLYICGKDQFINLEKWEHVLRKYSSFVIQGKMAEYNPNDINYFKGQTITDPNTGNKTSLYDAVVENVDCVIYLVERERVNLQEDSTFNKNYGNLVVKDKGTAESEKF